MSAGVFIQNEGDILFSSIEFYDHEPCVEIEIVEASGEVASIRISSSNDLDKFIDNLRNLYYEMKQIEDKGKPKSTVITIDPEITDKEVPQ